MEVVRLSFDEDCGVELVCVADEYLLLGEVSRSRTSVLVFKLKKRLDSKYLYVLREVESLCGSAGDGMSHWT